MKSLEAEWMKQQETVDEEMISLVASDPEKASQKATQDSMKRAEETFARLKEIEASLEERVEALSADDKSDDKKADTTTSSSNNLLIFGLGAIVVLGLAGFIYSQKKSKADQ